jgi:tryptophanyl-tRNA synthetase
MEEHKKKGGNPEIDVSFQYLKHFFEESDERLNQLEKDYTSGKISTGEMKLYTIEKINQFLKEHQKRRESAKSKISNYFLKD